ncbi:GNAT family N-acetyltransferase [Actinoplanes sp. NPDC051851]|uniref:GNAT family N-acetyltransferase n=1 Tax=Actinoplanes sp. NPDC051851 TaxID=3154753 RepID=UPI003421347C
MTISIADVISGDASFGPAAALFDEYRVHYGETAQPERTRHWLTAQLSSGRMAMTVAVREDGRAAGLITRVAQPASLRLGTVCMIRDLFVAPEQRRGGVARLLLDHVIAEARTAGALRVSLQTEPENTAAQALYASLGFRHVTGLDLLNLSLTAG